MNPFPALHPEGSPKRIDNYRLSIIAWRVVENVFGIVFRVFQNLVLLSPKKIELVNSYIVN